MFQKGLVQEVIYDPFGYDWEPHMGELEPDPDAEEADEPPNVSDSILDVPHNSLLVRIISDNKYKNEQKLKVAYPFLSSHIMMPVKVGEVVWLFEDGDQLFWLSRVHGKLCLLYTSPSPRDRG